MTVLAASSGLLVQPGTTAFLVIFGMGVVLVFVFRSMAKHLRKVAMAAREEAEAAARAESARPDTPDTAARAEDGARVPGTDVARRGGGRRTGS